MTPSLHGDGTPDVLADEGSYMGSHEPDGRRRERSPVTPRCTWSPIYAARHHGNRREPRMPLALRGAQLAAFLPWSCDDKIRGSGAVGQSFEFAARSRKLIQ